MGEIDQNGLENPWESASNDQVFREQAAAQTQEGGEPSTPAVTSVRWDIDENNHSNNTANTNDVSFLTSDTGAEPNGNRRRGPRAACSNCISKCSLSYFLHVWDILLTIFWTVFVGYHLYYNRKNETSRSAHMVSLLVLFIVLAVLNALRGLLWIWASLPSLSMICCCGCCCDGDNGGMATVSKLATHLTLWLGIVYGSVSVAAWFGPSSWLPWCDGLGPWCSKLIHTQTLMPIALTIASVIEMLRWIFLQGKLSSSSSTSMARTRSPDYYNDDLSASPSESSRHRPWWIGRHRINRSNNDNDGLNDLLLGSGTTSNVQPSWTTTSWIPFSTRGSSSRNDNGTNSEINGDEEDVASVLDSLGEDWASRAESDPYWWTR
jgi:hypothetical protein